MKFTFIVVFFFANIILVGQKVEELSPKEQDRKDIALVPVVVQSTSTVSSSSNNFGQNILTNSASSNKGSDEIALWALIVSILNLVLIVSVRFHHTLILKKIQNIGKNDLWSQQVVGLVAVLITEIEKPSGEDLQIRLKKSFDFNKTVNQLKLLLDIKDQNQKDLLELLNTINGISDSTSFISRLTELSNKIIFIYGKS